MRRGFSLVELLIATALLGTLLTVASYILIQGLHAWSTAMSRTDEENSVLVASSKLIDRLTKTDPRSLTLYSAPSPETGSFVPVVDSSPAAALSFLAGEDYLPFACGACCCKKALAGSMKWNRFLVWYPAADNSGGSPLTQQALWLKTVWLTAPCCPTANPTPFSLPGFTACSAEDQVMVRNIDKSAGFEVSAPVELPCLVPCCTVPLHTNPVTFSIRSQWQGGVIIYSKNHTSSASMLENTCQDPGMAPLGPSPKPPPCGLYCPNCCPGCTATPCPGAVNCPCPNPPACPCPSSPSTGGP